METPIQPRERRRDVRGQVFDREEDGPLALGGREARQLKRKKSATARRHRDDDEEETIQPTITRKKTHIRRTGANTAAPRKEVVVVQMPCTLRGFPSPSEYPRK